MNLNVHNQPPIKRHDKTGARTVSLESADDRRGPALEDPENPSSVPRSVTRSTPRDHPVAVHGLIEVAAGDEDVAGHSFDRAVGTTKPNRVGVW